VSACTRGLRGSPLDAGLREMFHEFGRQAQSTRDLLRSILSDKEWHSTVSSRTG
jgi:hypothetical protein